MRKIAIGAGCFMLGALGLALADTGAVRPEIFLALPWAWTATQSATPQSLSISGSTFTPVAGGGNNIKFTLSHAACPCTFANPSGTMVEGTAGVIDVKQSSVGGDLIGTWGSSYLSEGGTAAITLSTAANAVDTFSYYVRDATHIVVTAAAANPTH